MPGTYSLRHLFLNRSAALLVAAFLTGIANSYSQDTIFLLNGDILAGEIKQMTNGVLEIETPYSDSDFKIEWNRVLSANSTSFYLINLTDGTRVNGTFRRDTSDLTKIRIISGNENYAVFPIDIVYIKAVERDLWSRFDALVEFGFNITKANNLRQLNSRVSFGYTARTWTANLSYNTVVSTQDSVSATRRMDGLSEARWFLPRDWFIGVSSTFLRNDEQQIALRATPQVAYGKYLYRTNSLYLTAAMGLALNIEQFTGETDTEMSSLEGIIGVTANLFDVGDLRLKFKELLYPGLSNWGRIRSDTSLDIKYDFFRDLYFKIGFTLNFDNMPIAGASRTDYVLQTAFGWDF